MVLFLNHERKHGSRIHTVYTIALCVFSGGGPGEVSYLDLRPYYRPHGCKRANEFSKMEPQDCGQFSQCPAQAVVWPQRMRKSGVDQNISY